MSQEVRYGELTSWDDGDVTASSNDFLNLQEGENRVRVFTNPYQFYVAWVKDTSGANRKIRGAAKNCPLVKRGFDVKPRWFIGVLDRKSGQPKILEISSQAYKGIRNYNASEEWGDIREYDVDVHRNPKGSQPLYEIMPCKPKPLTDEEKALIERFNERVDIAKFTQPPTPQEVEEKLAEYLGSSNPTPQVKQGTVSVKPPTDASPTVSDDEFDFGDDDDM